MKIDKKKYPLVADGYQYAQDIITGKIPSCWQIKASCERFIRDLDDDRFIFDFDKAERGTRLVQKFPHIKGPLANTPMHFEPWQNFIYINVFGFLWKHTGFRRFTKIFVLCARKNGKALDVNTEIATPDGYVKMSDLREGDVVMGLDGKGTNVVFKSDTQYRDSYEFEFCNGEKITSCEDHNWVTYQRKDRRRKNGSSKIVTSKEIHNSIRCAGEINHYVPVTSPIEFGKKVLHVDPYIMGYWIGDGFKWKGGFSTGEQDVVEYFSQKYKTKSTSKYDYQCTGLRKDLKNYRLSSGEKKYIPSDFLTSSIDDRLGLLRGLMDSDGGVSSKFGDVEFSQSDKTIINDVGSLLTSLGIKHRKVLERESSYVDKDGARVKCKKSYRLLFKPMINVFRCSRKSKAWESCRIKKEKRYSYYNKIISSKYIGKTKVECISVDNENSLYLATKSNIPTHNTALSSGLGLYMMTLDGEQGAEIYSLAGKKDQARIVFDSAREQAKRSATFLKKTGMEVFRHHIEHDETASVYKPLASDSNSLDGLGPHLVVFDEIHSFKDRNLYGVMETAVGARKQPMLWGISTAGFDTTGICYELQIDLEKVLKREYDDESQFGMIYTIDKEDDFRDKKCWIKANPNIGVSLGEEYIQGMVDKAIRQPGNKNNILTKHFNIWCTASENLFDMLAYDECADPNLKIEQFISEKCYTGVDLASKIDLTGFIHIFKKGKDYYMFSDAFLPEAAIESSMNASYPAWVEQGTLISTKGEAINYDQLEEYLEQKSKDHKIQDALFDPWAASQFAQNMSKIGIEMTEFKMNTGNVSEPLKFLDAIIREKRLHHNGNPVLRWCFSNVMAKEDHNGNIYFRKSHEKFKIDLAVAATMAIAGWINEEEDDESVYETRGLTFF